MAKGGNTHRQPQAIENITDKIDFRLDLLHILLPESPRIRFRQAGGCSFLYRPCGGVAKERVRVLHGLDEVRGTNHETEAPSCCVEELADRAHGQGVGGYGIVERGDVREGGHEVNALVDLVAEDDEVVVDADGSDGDEFVLGEDFTEGILPRKKKKKV